MVIINCAGGDDPVALERQPSHNSVMLMLKLADTGRLSVDSELHIKLEVEAPSVSRQCDGPSNQKLGPL